jgi:selenide,water dikinase
VGLDTPDDAAVYQLNSQHALVQTVDFFTPIVNDPFLFGQIAAANALSDIYAMGGRPLVALNIVAFPCKLDFSILREILRGGKEKVEEAGAYIIGGHTVDDDEPKYGLAITGLVNPDEVTSLDKAKPGEVLILTKPLGIGILATALKADLVTEKDIEEAILNAAYLNKGAAEVALKVGAKAVTDITGFGFLGHLFEMLKASNVAAEIELEKVPIYEKALEFVEMGIMPAGLHNNRGFLEGKVHLGGKLQQVLLDMLYDPETSGGLLISVPENRVDEALSLLKDESPCASVVGKIVEGTPSVRVI